MPAMGRSPGPATSVRLAMSEMGPTGPTAGDDTVSARQPGPSHTLSELLRADFAGFMNLDGEKVRSVTRRTFDVLTLPGFWAVVIYRLSALAHRRGLVPVSRLLMVLDVVLFSCEISPRVEAGPGLVVPHPQGVAIGGGVRLGRDVRILRGVAIGTAGYRDSRRDGFPVVEDGCSVCDGAKLFGPITVGTGATVGASVTLFESVPAGAQVVARRTHEIRPTPG